MEPGTSSQSPLADSLDRLYARPAHVIKLGLETEAALLDRLGNPHRRLPHIHVAGTNGKGSVCALVEAALRAAGFKTGLYTSPHLVRFNERIRINGACVSDRELAELFLGVEAMDREGAAAPGGREATFFEFTTAMAFEHFRREKADVAVLETGMGGRLDATNVVTPLVCAITRIGVEHTAYLGDTIEKIAAEKSGIIKPGCAVICGQMPDAARAVVERTALERGSRLIRVEDVAAVRRLGQALAGQKVRIETAGGLAATVTVSLLGRHQLENIALAAAVIEYLNETTPFVADAAALKKGFAAARWPGRLDVLSAEPPVILDGAHNPDAGRALADSLRELVGRKPLGLVLGMLSDKDCRGFVAALAPLVKRCWIVPIRNPRAMETAALAECAKAGGLEPARAELGAALAEAREWAAGAGGAVCITGSLMLAGEVLAHTGRADPFA